MLSEPRRPHLEQLLQRADTAGQGEERVAVLVHRPLAFAHRVDDDQFVRLVVGRSRMSIRCRGMTPDCVRAARTRRPGDRAHHRDPAAAGDQRVPACRQPGSDRARPARRRRTSIRSEDAQKTQTAAITGRHGSSAWTASPVARCSASAWAELVVRRRRRCAATMSSTSSVTIEQVEVGGVDLASR